MKSQQNPASMKEYNLKVKKYLPGGVHYNFRLPWEETLYTLSKQTEAELGIWTGMNTLICTPDLVL